MTEKDGPEVLPEHVCWELLRSTVVGRLATCGPDGPRIFPVNFVVDHGTVVFRTAPGSKLTAVADPAHVAFETDGYDAPTGRAWSVVLQGRATEVRQLHERVAALELPVAPWHGEPKPHVVRIVPDLVSGRRFPVVDPRVWSGPTSGARRSAVE